MHAMHGMIVSQFRNDRFPVQISVIWKPAIRMPATFRACRGQKQNHGTMNSTK